MSLPRPAAGGTRSDLLGLSRDELASELESEIDRSFRIEQIYRAIYYRGVSDFADITELGLELRRRLAARYRLGFPVAEQLAVSRDGTRKYAWTLHDGAAIETVSIPEPKRTTLCISSQAGCALGCRFCVTGTWGAGRDLTAGEIVGQVLHAGRRDAELSATELGGRGLERPGINLVLMGMGEPLLNLENVKRALEILAEKISWRRMTLSTVGMIPGIEAMARWSRRPNLAVSLHAPDDERRSEIMPINRRYPLDDLFSVLRGYPLEGQRRMTFEYTLIRGFNDSLADARRLSSRIRGLEAKVNLIPLNPDPVLRWSEGRAMERPPAAVVRSFQQELLGRGVACSVRRPRGDDIQAACGQLRASSQRPLGVSRRQISE